MKTTNLTTVLSNLIIISLIKYESEYPWYRYIYNSQGQIEDVLPSILLANPTDIEVYINTDDETIQFAPQQPNPDTDSDTSFTISNFTFHIYMD